MTTTASHTGPPRWLQSAVSSLLPPHYREAVLGDLQERFAERGARRRWAAYLRDIATTVPHVWRSQMRRVVTGRSACEAALPDLRNRAEQFQTQVWLRNAVILVASIFLFGIFLLNAQGAWTFAESVSLAMTIGWVAAAWRSYAVHGRSTSVPASLPWNELRAFHRRELIRQMDLGCREFVYWSVPAVLLIAYALAVRVPGFRGGVMLLFAIAMQNSVIAWAHWKERSRYQRELDRLDRDVVLA